MPHIHPFTHMHSHTGGGGCHARCQPATGSNLGFSILLKDTSMGSGREELEPATLRLPNGTPTTCATTAPDSEVTGSSMSIRESISDHSCTHSLARSSRSHKRRNNSTAGTNQRRSSQETLLLLRRSANGPKVHWSDRGAADSYEIKVYEIDNVNSLQRRGLSSSRGVACFSAKLKFLEHRQQRIVELRLKYNHLKRELEQAKQHLMLDPEKWSREFDLWQTFEVDSLEHLEALELVTARLESRVNQCKAHMMMVTSFDAAPKRRQKKNKRHRPSPDQKGFL